MTMNVMTMNVMTMNVMTMNVMTNEVCSVIQTNTNTGINNDSHYS